MKILLYSVGSQKFRLGLRLQRRVPLLETAFEARAERNLTAEHVIRRHQPWGQMSGIPSLRTQDWWWVWRERKRAFGDAANTLENAWLRKSRQMRILKKWSPKIKHTISKSRVSNIKERAHGGGGGGSMGSLLHLAFGRSPLTSEKVAGGRQESGTGHTVRCSQQGRRQVGELSLEKRILFWCLCSSLPQIPQWK